MAAFDDIDHNILLKKCHTFIAYQIILSTGSAPIYLTTPYLSTPIMLILILPLLTMTFLKVRYLNHLAFAFISCLWTGNFDVLLPLFTFMWMRNLYQLFRKEAGAVITVFNPAHFQGIHSFRVPSDHFHFFILFIFSTTTIVLIFPFHTMALLNSTTNQLLQFPVAKLLVFL